MRTSKADRLALLFLVIVPLLSLLAPSWTTLASAVEHHVLPEHACVQAPVPGLVYCPASSARQSGGHQ
ncbi:hypothetical protein ACFYY2_31380 [Streptomyces sp. NPDC001822]|uniref:hypothetical protein n=1 Tax=Streptomyces sp. NPDC001822 TaxID=3364614 RepID=UPI00368D9196